MNQPDPQKAPGAFHTEVLGEIDGVVIPIPGEKSSIAQLGGEFGRRVAMDSDRQRPTAFVEAGAIGDAVNLEPWDAA